MSIEGLDALNVPQREAVSAPAGNLLVLAGAGSGKTRVLVSRFAWLVHEQGLAAGDILAVTFTNKAANEMKQRLQGLVTASSAELWVGTFHGLCHRFLRRHATLVGLAPTFQILDVDEQGRLLKKLIQEQRLDETQWPVKAVQSFINGKKEDGIRAKQITPLPYGPSRTYGVLYTAYEQACQRLGVVDFSELLLRCCELFRDHPDILQHYQARFKAILVDEFQDTNTIQYVWLRLLAGTQTQVMAVGDDDQSIYGWRGAKIENIHQFEKDFSDVQIIRLEQNYRSTANILTAANALIEHNFSRLGKALWTEGDKGEKITVYGAINEFDEARFVGERIQQAVSQGIALDEIAILYRSNAQSRVFEEAFLRQGIAYRIEGGVRYFERAEIKDVLAYLRLIVNVHDDSAFERVVNMPARGVGEKTLMELRAQAEAQKTSLWSVLQQACVGQLDLSTRARSALLQFQQIVCRLLEVGETQAQALELLVEQVIEYSGLLAHYQAIKTEDGQARVENLKELVNAAKQFCYDVVKEETETWLVAFLSHISLEAGDRQASTEVSVVRLMTLHAAKGLEFPIVFMVGVEEGVFPARASLEDPKRLEEERRLCYVGMTRAMRQLFMSYAEIRRQYGREEYHRASRFLQELPPTVLAILRGERAPQMGISTSTRSSFSTSKPFMPKTAETASPYPLGTTVVHPAFGEGVVLAYEGSGANLRVQVRFQSAGTKWLVVAYAKLIAE